jgi:hypothetical protein
MKKRVLVCLFALLAGGAGLFGLPHIPGCPLHESCVRALRQEQRNRRRGLKNTDRVILPARSDGASTLSLGVQGDLGNLTDEAILGLRPNAAWFGGVGNFDIYLGAFYTLNFDYPLNQKTGFQEFLSYSFFPGDAVTLSFGLDNDNQLSISPGTAEMLYAVAEPSLNCAWDLSLGEINFGLAFPLGYSPEFSVDTGASFGYRFSFGLYLETAVQIWVAPEPDYGETELSLSWPIGRFYTALTLTADKYFRTYSIEPYLACSIGAFTLLASVLIDGIGGKMEAESAAVSQDLGLKDDVFIVPSLGLKYRF